MQPAESTGFSEPGLHPLITQERESGNGYYVSARHFEQAREMELVAIKLNSGDSLKRGGGAGRKNNDKRLMDESTLKKSKGRAARTIRRKALALCADRMITLTFRENVTDIDEAWGCFKYFIKLMRKHYEKEDRKFAYIAVPEYQKRGAVHFHLAVSGFYHVSLVRRLWHRAVGKRQGNIDITDPKKFGKNSWNPRRVAQYIAKYISKQDSVEFNRRRYSSGGQIEVPEPEKGWLVLGAPVVHVFRQIIEARTRKQIRGIWESEGYFGVIVATT